MHCFPPVLDTTIDYLTVYAASLSRSYWMAVGTVFLLVFHLETPAVRKYF